MTATRAALILGAVYLTLVVAANWLAATFVVGVPLTGYTAPAGVYAIGAVLVLRDWIQQLSGLGWSLGLAYLAGALSYLIGNAAGWSTLERVALASVAAFTLSETLEAVVFTPMRRRHLAAGVAASGAAGLVLDSLVFLWLAFGTLTFLPGQIIAKAYVVAAGVALTVARRRWLPVLDR